MAAKRDPAVVVVEAQDSGGRGGAGAGTRAQQGRECVEQADRRKASQMNSSHFVTQRVKATSEVIPKDKRHSAHRTIRPPVAGTQRWLLFVLPHC